MKNLKFLFVTVILTCFIGVMQSEAQAYIERGTQDKWILYEVDGEKYLAVATVNYQYEYTPGGVFNWVSRGEITESFMWDDGLGDWVALGEVVLPKRKVEATDAYAYYDERITVNPQGKVLVVAHSKN